MSEEVVNRALELTFREANDSDWEGIAGLIKAYETGGVTAKILQDRNSRWDERDPLKRTVVIEPSGGLVGYGRAMRKSEDPSGLFRLNVYVHPTFAGRGIGKRLLAEMEAFGIEHLATSFMVGVEESCPRGQAFADKNGYANVQHLFESRLELVGFDAAPYQMAQALLEDEGYRFFSMEDAGDTDENWRRVYDLDCAADSDTPGSENWGLGTFEEYQARWRAEPGFSLAGVFLAEWKGDWVGVNMVRPRAVEGEMATDFTGVLREHRGKGLAKVLKSLGIQYGQAKGYRTMVTNNDERNAPMLKINAAFGFAIQPGFFFYKKDLHSPAEGAAVTAS